MSIALKFIFRSFQVVWHDKRKKVSSIDLARVSGVILNIMSTMQVGFLKLPIRRRHWVAIQVGSAINSFLII